MGDSCSMDTRHEKRIQNFSPLAKMIGSCKTHMYSERTVSILLCVHRDSKKGGKFLYPSQLPRDYIPRCSYDTVLNSDATGRFELCFPSSKTFSEASHNSSRRPARPQMTDARGQSSCSLGVQAAYVTVRVEVHAHCEVCSVLLYHWTARRRADDTIAS